MNCNTVLVSYTGAAPGADSNTYVLFDTTTMYPMAGAIAQVGLKRLWLDLAHDADGTLNWYKSPDRGVTWIQLDTSGAITAPTNTTTVWDWHIEGYRDFKVEWVNAGSEQELWVVDLALSPERVPLFLTAAP